MESEISRAPLNSNLSASAATFVTPIQIVYDAPEEYQRRDFAAGTKLQQARHGSERAAVDSPWQLPGDFVVDRHGVLRLTYRAQFCDDYVDPQVLVAAIREAVLDL